MREDKIMSKLDTLYNKYGKEFYFVFDWELSEEEMQQLVELFNARDEEDSFE